MPDYTRSPLYRRTEKPTLWLGSRTSESNTDDALLTENGFPITTEDDEHILIED